MLPQTGQKPCPAGRNRPRRQGLSRFGAGQPLLQPQHPRRKPQPVQAVQGAYLAPQIAPQGGIIPHRPAHQPVAEQPKGKLHPGYQAAAQKAPPRKGQPGEPAVQPPQQREAKPAGRKHGPVGAPPVQKLQGAVSPAPGKKQSNIAAHKKSPGA